MTDRLYQILTKYNSQIALVLGAHTHLTRIVGNETFAMITTPSISPVTYTNPGFTTFELNQTAQNFKLHYFNLLWYTASKTVAFYEFDLFKEYGLKEFTPVNVHKMIEGV